MFTDSQDPHDHIVTTEERCPKPFHHPVAVGDVIHFLDTPHQIASLADRTTDDRPIARASDGWGISLAEDGCLIDGTRP